MKVMKIKMYLSHAILSITSFWCVSVSLSISERKKKQDHHKSKLHFAAVEKESVGILFSDLKMDLVFSNHMPLKQDAILSSLKAQHPKHVL